MPEGGPPDPYSGWSTPVGPGGATSYAQLDAYNNLFDLGYSPTAFQQGAPGWGGYWGGPLGPYDSFGGGYGGSGYGSGGPVGGYGGGAYSGGGGYGSQYDSGLTYW